MGVCVSGGHDHEVLLRRMTELPVPPIAWATAAVSERDDQPSILGYLAIDDVKRIPLEQEEPLPIVAQGIPLRVCGNRFQGLPKRGLEPFGSTRISFGVPLKRLRVLLLGSLSNQEVIHQTRPSVELGLVRRARLRPTCVPRRTRPSAVGLRQPIPRRVAASPRAGHRPKSRWPGSPRWMAGNLPSIQSLRAFVGTVSSCAKII